MNAYSIFSAIFAVWSLVLIIVGIWVDAALMVGIPLGLLAVYLDHLGIEKELRDFLSSEEDKP